MERSWLIKKVCCLKLDLCTESSYCPHHLWTSWLIWKVSSNVLWSKTIVQLNILMDLKSCVCSNVPKTLTFIQGPRHPGSAVNHHHHRNNQNNHHHVVGKNGPISCLLSTGDDDQSHPRRDQHLLLLWWDRSWLKLNTPLKNTLPCIWAMQFSSFESSTQIQKYTSKNTSCIWDSTAPLVDFVHSEL